VAEDRAAQFRDQFRFVVAGTKYEYKGYLSAADALLVKKHAGLTALEMFQGLELGDPGALVGIVFVTKRQCGERITWDEVVDQIDGEDDLLAVMNSFEAIDTEPAPAVVKGAKPQTRKAEAEPAV
jgi:hypothetical protein